MKICFTVASLKALKKLNEFQETLYYRGCSSKNLFDCCLIKGKKV